MKIQDLIAKAAIPYGLLCLAWFGALEADEFPFEPPQNFKLHPKYIVLHHPVKTSQLLAQLYFDQGLTFLYAFNHDAAYWSFLRAAESDSNMAMAYWGMALALGTNINIEITPKRSEVAYHAIQKAIQLSADGPENEKRYIQALAKRYSKDPQADRKQLAQDYNQAMRELSHQYPDDLDAAVLYAESILDLNPWNQWSTDGKPLEGTMEAVKILESVLQRDPNHLGANHYFIHAVEASRHPEIALMSAERLKTLMPSSGHLLHMPSHIYLLVGDYIQAARSNEAAIAADREHIREYGTMGIYPIHYLSHNFSLLARAYVMLGRFEDAKRAANDLAALYLSHFKRMPELEYYASSPLIVLLVFHRWRDILDMPKPSDEMKMTNALWHFGRAMAFLGLNDVPRAREEQQQFLEEKKKISPEQEFGNNKFNDIFQIAYDCLQAKLAEAQGNFPQAVDFLKQAIAEQDSLRYNEPPDWFLSTREMLGGFLLRVGRPAEAETVFREELKKHPRGGRSLFGLRESLRAQSKSYDSYWVNEEFQKAWMYSGISLTINDL
jgi:tetratricopeptide (TPR) repeat protein